MRDPVKILVKNEELVLDNIKQFYVVVDSEKLKYDRLIKVLNNLEIEQCIIYCSTSKSVDDLSKTMKGENLIVGSIHSGMDSDARQLVMEEFRTGSSRILISTDILSRGVDIERVNLVINYDLT